MLNVRKFLNIDPDYRFKVYRRDGQLEEPDEDDEEESTEVCLNFKK